MPIITNDHFGANIVLTKDSAAPASPFQNMLDEISFSHFRYPGGGVTENHTFSNGGLNKIFSHEPYQAYESATYKVFTDDVEQVAQYKNAEVPVMTLGRRSEIALGRSFDEVFAESYERSAIRRASNEQKRLWLMGQKPITMQKGHGRIHLFGNYYWSDWMSELAGRKVVARFDIEHLHAGTYVYELTGEFLGFAPCIQAVGFYDLTSAKDNARQKSAFMRAQKRMLEKERQIKPQQVAAELNETRQPNPVPLENKIVAMPKGDARPAAARVTRPVYKDRMTPEEEAEVIEFQKRHYEELARKEAAAKEEEPIDRFERAVELQRRLDAGHPSIPSAASV